MSAPAQYDITIYQGATFRETITWKAGDAQAPVDLSGCTARMQIRSSVDSPTKLLDLTTENGGLVLGGSEGTIQIIVTSTATEGASWREGVYDLEIVLSNGEVRRLLQGSAKLIPEVTRV